MCFQLHLRLGNSTLPQQKTLYEALWWIGLKRKDLSLILDEEVPEVVDHGGEGTSFQTAPTEAEESVPRFDGHRIPNWPLLRRRLLIENPHWSKSNVLRKLSQHRCGAGESGNAFCPAIIS
jgi:hypothetical protein